ncbi:MAG: hypothetical protein MSC31_18035 [Solirubrobacteraceae bacterium MAG38_C4-C5]|nr:hypothetical protein [Candidatus Siliceabacter maunaloa]
MTLQLGILLALLCAAMTNLAFLFKHRGACAAPDVCVRHPFRTARQLWSSKWFAVGMIVGGGAWVLHVGAVSLAPLSIVQAILSGGLVMLAVMADRLFGHRVSRRQWWGLALTATGLVLLGVTLPAANGDHSAFSLPAMIAFQGGLFAAGALLIVGPRLGGRAEHHGIMLAAAAGLMFGMGNIGVKALTGIAQDGVLALLLSPWSAVAIMASISAFYCSARSLQKGEAVAVIAITGTIANTAAIAGGIVVFGDPMPSDALGIVLQALAFTLVIVASALTPGPLRAAGAGVPGGGPAAAAGRV